MSPENDYWLLRRHLLNDHLCDEAQLVADFGRMQALHAEHAHPPGVHSLDHPVAS